MSAARETVSSPCESLILVDKDDREIGVSSKADCHRGDGILHRAFSVFLFNDDGQLLLQQRSKHKPLWPLYWSNSCCSHPRVGEQTEAAAHRRIAEELSLSCELQFLYKFTYQASFGALGSEREFCSVFAGRHQGQVTAHPEEIAAWRYVTPEQLTVEIEAKPQQFTPWLMMEWAQIRRDNLLDILKA